MTKTDTRLDPKALLEGITPGPWALSNCRTDRDIRVISTVPGVAGTVAHCGPLGFGYGRDFEANDEGVANARIVAAAPQLARELIEAREALAECLPDLEHYAATHGPGPDRRLAKARAILAR